MEKSKLVLIFILIIASLLRIPHIAQGFFAFTYDQGNDLLKVKEIVVDHNPTLIGPKTGIPGVFYGPWWYYFLSPIFLISSGDPEIIILVFAFIGIATVLATYFLFKKLTSNEFIAIFSAATVALSQVFITAANQMWSPSLIPPLMLAYIFSIAKIIEKSKKSWFLILGLASGFILDSETAFGTMLIVSTIVVLIIRKFPPKNILLFFAGLLIVVSPRIIFDLKHDFLITKSLLGWLSSPVVYQEQLSFSERIVNRAFLFFNNFSQTFSQSNKILAIIPLTLLIALIAASKSKLKKDNLSNFLILILLGIYIGFTIYPDTVWDYYLGGLPLIFLTIFALSLKYIKWSIPISLLCTIILLAVNFNPKLISPFSLTWQGDGAIFKNQKAVIESLKDELKGDYSLHVYTPAMFDYPFDYLIWWYNQNGQIDLPKVGQKRMYLIIRDDDSHLYLPTGWYGDKVRDNTELRDRKIFPGNIIVEKHERR